MKSHLVFSLRAVVAVALVLAFSALAVAQTGTALIRHAPAINGTVEGSIQVLTAESVTLNSGAAVSGDLLVPGTPTVRLNGRPTYGGTVDASGAASPTHHQVTLNGNASLRSVVRRTDAVPLPDVSAPPAPAGTRTVVLNSVDASPGDFASLRHLTLTGDAGSMAIPPGVYGEFTANGQSGFTLGIAGATQPAVYAFQRLTLNGQSTLRVVGPVIVTVATSLNANGSIGASSQPAWLRLQLSTGGLTLNGGVAVYGYVIAPGGTVLINGNAQLVGSLAADRLTINGNGRLRLQSAVTPNRSPTITFTAPSDQSSFVAPAAFTLRASATDADGTIARVEFFQGAVKLSEDTIAPFEHALSGVAVGTHVFTARATDNLGGSGDTAPLTIVVTGPNRPPVIALTHPVDGALLTAPATIALAATASDPDGTIARVEFFAGATKMGDDVLAPYSVTTAPLAAGTHIFSARAIDNAGALSTSATVSVTVVNPNAPPTVALLGPPGGSRFSAPAAFVVSVAAADSDGAVARVELFRGTTKIGEDATAPYEFAVSESTAGNFTYVARATDQLGSATDSPPLTIEITSENRPPVVTLLAPATGAVLDAPATIAFLAQASDPDGTVARVEFFAGTIKVGEDTTAPFEWVWPAVPPGTYVLSARATDNGGAATTTPPTSVTVQVVLPYFTSFESVQGFALGALAGQAGWATTGNVNVLEGVAFDGTRSVSIAGSTPAGQLAHAFPPYTGKTVVFVDFFAKPVATANAAASTIAQTDFGRVAFVQNGLQGELFALDGDPAGAGVWRTTGTLVPLATDGSGAAANWLRLTLRGDFVARRWDLFASGRLVAFDRAFAETAAPRFTQFSLTGHLVGATRLDDFFAGFENPLFADADRDGLDDAWEIANGLNPAANDRAADGDGDGVSNLFEFQLGTRANVGDSDGDGVLDGLELATGRNPLKGAIADANGVVNLRVYSPSR